MNQVVIGGVLAADIIHETNTHIVFEYHSGAFKKIGVGILSNNEQRFLVSIVGRGHKKLPKAYKSVPGALKAKIGYGNYVPLSKKETV